MVSVEDGSFQKGITLKALFVAVLFKGLRIKRVQTVRIAVDSLDATEKLVTILRGWKFGAVILAHFSFAGFNVIDPKIIHEEFGKPIIVMSRTKPDNKAVKRALRRQFGDRHGRWDVFKSLGPAPEIASLGRLLIYVETVGVEWEASLLGPYRFSTGFRSRFVLRD